jgi:N4-gp56 family major capsid protein
MRSFAMSGLTWSVPAEGGFLYNDELSDRLRMAVQPLTKFRQFCDAEDGTQKGLGRGELFTWDIVSDVARQGWQLDENVTMPETNMTVRQGTLTVQEWGNSVPFTGKLENLAKHKVVAIIDKALKNDARKAFDKAAFLQFKNTTNRFNATSGTSTTAITVTTNSATSVTNDVAMGTGHVKAISDYMKEANVPPYEGDSYMCISHPTTYRTFKNSLESIHQYTNSGLEMIRYGEIGRYEDVRFVEQNCIPKGGANDSTTFDAINGTADAWDNTDSSWAFFFGADTVTEAIVIPEEIRAKLPGDYGRSRGIAWYALLNFGLVHATSTDCRVFMWDSAA